MAKKATRLHFTEDDLKDSKVRRAAKKAEKAADKADRAIEKLPKKRKLRAESQGAVSRKKKFRGEKIESGKPSRAKRIVTHAPVTAAFGKIHHEVSKHEDENVGIEAAHKVEGAVEAGAHTASYVKYSGKMRAYKNADKLEKKSDKANIDALWQKQKAEHPQTSTNPLSRWRQKQEIKKQYAAVKAGKAGTGSAAAGSKGAQGAGKTAKKSGNIVEKTMDFVKSHPKGIIFILIFAVLIMIVAGGLSSCSALFQGGGGAVIGSSFTAEDEDIIGANDDYKALETALRNRINGIEEEYPGYDEYRYHVDEINHNPYELTAYLTVLFEDYTREEVQSTLSSLFDRQYELTTREEVEIRTREVEVTVTDPETGEETTEMQTEEYEYYILHVTLTNKGMGSAILSSGLTDDQKERYQLLLETKGNRPYLFEDDIYANSGGEYTDYDIPGEALSNERFANMIREAEKYLGYPYVWGGSNPSTSFDCSGFVCWVINNCGNGWSVGRTTADGLMAYCDIISAEEAQPGDLIFFQGTYATTGASHVGIYVGGGMMIHCGNPISYASVETSYWQSHFYCYGRIR